MTGITNWPQAFSDVGFCICWAIVVIVFILRMP